MPNEEIEIYRTGDGVTITNRRLIFPGRTYALSNVASVQFRVIRESTGAAKVLAGLAAFLTLFGLRFSVGEEPCCGMSLALLGGVMLVVAIVKISQSKTRYAVRIAASSGEADAVVSESASYAKAIVDAVNQAMAQ